MGRYEQMFDRLAADGTAAFVPFVVIGDPSLEASLGIIDALVDGGADALELGIPFSDPIADGPTIQAATVRALKGGVTPGACFKLLGQIRERHPAVPIGLLVYANLVVAGGEASFYKTVAEAGVDSVLVADVPVFEGAPFVQHGLDHGVYPVFIAPPNADEDLIARVAGMSKGYTYVVARPGVTGEQNTEQRFEEKVFDYLKKYNAPPGLLGFGISNPENVRAAIKAGAAGAISGSAVVRIIEDRLDAPGSIPGALTTFVKEMKSATGL
jgi:tryptophan synthase alpha chain